MQLTTERDESKTDLVAEIGTW